MLEVIVHGLYLGAPEELGAAGALVLWGGEELARFQECYRRPDIRSPLGAELRILATTLEWAQERGGMGETVTVRTRQGSLPAACQGRGEASRPEIQVLVESLERIALDFEGVHAEIAPGWVTAPAQEAALRAVVQFLESSARPGSGTPGWTPSQGGFRSLLPAQAPTGGLAARAEASGGGRS